MLTTKRKPATVGEILVEEFTGSRDTSGRRLSFREARGTLPVGRRPSMSP